MALVLFDLDNTLISGDSDHLWGDFLVKQGAVDEVYYQRENDRFYREYQEGKLDIYEFLSFSLRPLHENKLAQLQAWRETFLTQMIDPIIPQASRDLLQKHRQAGDLLVIITATNSFITGPIAERLGVENLLATEPERVDGHFTGGVSGLPCYREGKVSRLNSWLASNGAGLKGSWFYSDSHNDLPLLRLVDNPVAVDPDEQLRKEAVLNGWSVISLSNPR
ncbi:MAG: HAD-IB family hydrolase [Candidatus Polarisedimenticolaceae bacterium]|nr:HAD-IB family hydrolase [Candidatus Polarisedimenticolaceae bacterium]